eukprot:9060083-Pyramimonas_sp.AAC.1
MPLAPTFTTDTARRTHPVAPVAPASTPLSSPRRPYRRAVVVTCPSGSMRSTVPTMFFRSPSDTTTASPACSRIPPVPPGPS